MIMKPPIFRLTRFGLKTPTQEQCLVGPGGSWLGYQVSHLTYYEAADW
jgi:hypothetical protein